MKPYGLIFLCTVLVLLSGCTSSSDKKLAMSFNNTCIEKANAQDYKNALKDCDKAIEIYPEFTEAYTNRGFINISLEEYYAAIQDNTKAIEIDKNQILAYQMRGLARYYKGYYNDAIQDFTMTIILATGDNTEYFYLRGYTKIKTKDYRGAISDFNDVIRKNPNHEKAYRDRGIAYVSLREYDSAIADFDKALALEPNDKDVYAFRQQTKKAKKNMENAVNNIRYYTSDDDSGTDAGYERAEENDITDSNDCGGDSDSFIEGCINYAEGN